MPKNIVIFADGTAREGDGTNVSKLHYMVEDRSPEQLVLYIPGVGTERHKVAGMIGGIGISRYMLECYEFINANFMADDNIFLFGFSRGATTVMSLAKFIHLFGMLPRRPDILKKAFKIYKIRNPRLRLIRAREFVSRKYSMWTNIKFLGLFDAVAVLSLKFHIQDPRFSESVENLYHALAINEERLWFKPLLWDQADNHIQNHNRVWFCGNHSDIGGGYNETTLSDIPLEWMMQKAKLQGLRILERHRVEMTPEVNGLMHDETLGTWGKLYPRAKRSWDSATHGKPIIHESVLQRTLNKRGEQLPKYSPWILDGSFEYEVEPWSHS